MTARQRTLVAIVAFSGLSTLLAAQGPSLDYPQWRGPLRDGSAATFSEPKVWPEKLTMKWKVDVGPGYSTPILVGSRLYVFARREADEVMLALDPDSGKTIWQTSYPAPYKMNPATKAHGEGPKSTPLFYNGRLYTLGISGIVSAFDASNGKILWQKPAPPVDPLYGTAMSPIADRGMVIVHVGGHNQGALTAFDANTGDVKWAWTGDGPAYASPMIATIGGIRQLITVTQQNIVGLAVDTGTLLWKRPFVTRSTNAAITPILDGDTIIVSAQDLGVTAFKAAKQGDQWTTETLWETSEVSMFMSNPVLIRGTLYGLSHKSSGQLFALDTKTGKVLWLGKAREATNTAVVKAGELLFLLNDSGELTVARGSQTGLQPVAHYTVAESSTWAQPTISGNRVFVRDVSNLTLWTVM